MPDIPADVTVTITPGQIIRADRPITVTDLQAVADHIRQQREGRRG